MRLYASFLEKKEVKKTSPLTVVMEMELSNMIAFNRFSIFFMSFLGIWRKVSPKKMLLGLKLEWKQILLFVIYTRPLKRILSLKAQEKLLTNCSSGKKFIFDCRNYWCFDKFYFFSAFFSDGLLTSSRVNPWEPPSGRDSLCLGSGTFSFS